MVCGPASWPATARSQRSLAISFWTLASTWCEQDLGRRERGSKDAYPPSLNRSRSLKIQRYVMVAGELGRAAVFQDDCVDDVAAETGHAPPPSCWSALCPATWVNHVVKSDSTVPPTHKKVSGHGVQLMRVENGQIAEARVYYDQYEFMSQLGLIPAPATV